MQYQYKPKGVCSQQIILELDGDMVKSVEFVGGCSGNTQGVAALAVGRKVSDVINTLEGIRCGVKSTSCPDQLSKALKEAMQRQ
ncbi:MAG: TIGR03905 family TSCPD domain-containing protein [Oscillospiraceae bacterium]|nr:TIGR03905 family TSCPD domain-containing protein [Oscillospiraceae bacterium]